MKYNHDLIQLSLEVPAQSDPVSWIVARLRQTRQPGDPNGPANSAEEPFLERMLESLACESTPWEDSSGCKRYRPSFLASLGVSMRTVPAILLTFLLFSCPSNVWSQNENPFGGPGNPSDPFGGAATSPQQARKGQAQKARVIAVQRTLAGGRKPVQVQPARSNEAEMKIKAALNDETTQTFIETPLAEAIQVISTTHQIPILIDQRALEEIGLDSNESISIDLKNVKLRSFLRLMLRDLDLTYLIKDEVMQITTMEAAENNLIMEMYVLPPNLAAKSDQVIKVLTSMVVPDTWEQLGGNSSAMAVDHVLVISSTSDVIEQSEAFLEKLVQKYGK